eukprot:5105757-Heterocapsa_arctica.AAC.1
MGQATPFQAPPPRPPFYPRIPLDAMNRGPAFTPAQGWIAAVQDLNPTYSPASTPDRTVRPCPAVDPFLPPRHKGAPFLGHLRPPPPRPNT